MEDKAREAAKYAEQEWSDWGDGDFDDFKAGYNLGQARNISAKDFLAGYAAARDGMSQVVTIMLGEHPCTFSLCDLDIINQYKWVYLSKGRTAYAQTHISINGKRDAVQMHQLIMDSHRKGLLIDHIDHNGLNNTRENLRIVTYAQNCKNRLPNHNRRYKGAQKSGKYWQGRINVDGRQLCLGRYNTEEEAARAYDRAAIEHYGEYAYLNFPVVDEVK